MQDKNDTIRRWDNLIKQYMAQQKYLKDVGKLWVNKGKSVDNNVESELKEALTQTDKNLVQLKSFIVPRLDTPNLFVEDILKSEVQKLAEQNYALTTENENLKENVKDLQMNLNESEKLIAVCKYMITLISDNGSNSDSFYLNILIYRLVKSYIRVVKRSLKPRNLIKVHNFKSVNMQDKHDKIRQWDNLIKQYIAQHKYLKDVGELWINKGKNVDKDVKIKLQEALVQIDKSLLQLKSFFVPYLDTANLFEEDKLKSEIQKLAEENCRLMIENENLKEDIKNLQINRGQNEELINKNFQLLVDRKEEHFNSMLKAQNNLIENLKEDLEQSYKDVEMFRTLNKTLEIELKKHVANEDDLELNTQHAA
ncbi:hypothetical protein RN001_013480 [Aquatica leii]|uniref:Uncharacterized protein n=1 Tax=Aquatica leii TaxID=1421715 RepID=A0AAN7NWE5_9COLE|nr:hypothetical protein RN001_013480 [Aquatica leii]